MQNFLNHSSWGLVAVAAVGIAGYAVSNYAPSTLNDAELTTAAATESSSLLADAIDGMAATKTAPVKEEIAEVAEPVEEDIGKFVRVAWTDDILENADLTFVSASLPAAPVPVQKTGGWGGVSFLPTSGDGYSEDAVPVAAPNKYEPATLPRPSFASIPSLITQSIGGGSKPSDAFPFVISQPVETDEQAESDEAIIAPVPLPAGGMLLLSALFGLGWMRKRFS